MTFPKKYKILKVQSFEKAEYLLKPIRFEDRHKIMKWRNEQIKHLRQSKPLKRKEQDEYFNTVILRQFDQENPEQILFSFLKDDKCIGYGGLVHINWKQKKAEISFLIDTEIEKDHFKKFWLIFIGMIEKVAFNELDFNEIFTYSYEVRPNLYPILEQGGFIEKERILNAKLIENNPVDALIHIKRKNELTYRSVCHFDSQLLFDWANSTRNKSLNPDIITWKDHLKWFHQKMNDPKTKMFVFCLKKPVGVLRLDEVNRQLQISFSVDIEHRGKGIGNRMIIFALKKFSGNDFSAKVIGDNISSHRIFLKNNFTVDHISKIGNRKVTHYIKKVSNQ